MVNRLRWQSRLIEKRTRLRLALSSGGLIQYTTISLVKQSILSEMNRYQNVFMFCSCTAFLAWALKLTASNVLFKCALLPRITVGTKAEDRLLLGDFYKVYQNVLWNGTKIQTFRGWSLFLSGLKSCMHSIFQIFLKHFFSTSWVNILFCTTQAVGMSWIAKLSLLSLEGKVETNFKVFKGIFRERRLINKKSQSRS